VKQWRITINLLTRYIYQYITSNSRCLFLNGNKWSRILKFSGKTRYLLRQPATQCKHLFLNKADVLQGVYSLACVGCGNNRWEYCRKEFGADDSHLLKWEPNWFTKYLCGNWFPVIASKFWVAIEFVLLQNEKW